MSELRWHPLLGEWVITATHRQDRTFHPPPNYCPLCPTKPGGFPTEIPADDYEIAVFENKFPSLHPTAPHPAVESSDLYPVGEAQGVCEVVLYTSGHQGTLIDQPVTQIERLIRVWQDRQRELGDRPEIQYVYIFENKGREIGVTLEHPHGQIYAFPFIPPMIATELRNSQAHHQQTGHCLPCDIRESELTDGRRIVYSNEDWVAFVPFFARWPYEVHIHPHRHLGTIADLTPREVKSLARALKVVGLKYDNLFSMSMPYMMVMHSAPTDGAEYPHYHFHIEYYPPYRTAQKLKYLAGCESGAGTFINDTLAEEKAAELRKQSPQEVSS